MSTPREGSPSRSPPEAPFPRGSGTSGSREVGMRRGDSGPTTPVNSSRGPNPGPGSIANQTIERIFDEADTVDRRGRVGRGRNPDRSLHRPGPGAEGTTG